MLAPNPGICFGESSSNCTRDVLAQSRGYGAKYPLISRTRCAGLLANELIDPFAAAGTIAALAATVPSNEFRVDTSGIASPDRQSVRYPKAPEGTTVALSE